MMKYFLRFSLLFLIGCSAKEESKVTSVIGESVSFPILVFLPGAATVTPVCLTPEGEGAVHDFAVGPKYIRWNRIGDQIRIDYRWFHAYTGGSDVSPDLGPRTKTFSLKTPVHRLPLKDGFLLFVKDKDFEEEFKIDSFWNEVVIKACRR
jgi:hypothetical protein